MMNCKRRSVPDPSVLLYGCISYTVREYRVSQEKRTVSTPYKYWDFVELAKVYRIHCTPMEVCIVYLVLQTTVLNY